MQETFHGIHTHDDTNRDRHEEVHSNEDDNSVGADDTSSNGFLQKDSSQLTVSKRQSPQTEVRSSVRNATQNELDGFNDLMNSNFTDIVLLMSSSLGMTMIFNRSIFDFFKFVVHVQRSV